MLNVKKATRNYFWKINSMTKWKHYGVISLHTLCVLSAWLQYSNDDHDDRMHDDRENWQSNGTKRQKTTTFNEKDISVISFRMIFDVIFGVLCLLYDVNLTFWPGLSNMRFSCLVLVSRCQTDWSASTLLLLPWKLKTRLVMKKPPFK